MKKHQPKVDLGLVYGMYGGVGYPGYYMDAEVSKELFRLMRCCFRKFWKALKRFQLSIGERVTALQNLL